MQEQAIFHVREAEILRTWSRWDEGNTRYFTTTYSSQHKWCGFHKDKTPNKSPEDSGFYIMVIRPLRDCLCHGHWARPARAKNALQIGVDLTEERPKIILLVCSVCRICNSILQNSFGTDQAPTLPTLHSYIQTGMTSHTIGHGLKDRGSIPNRNFLIFPSRSDRPGTRPTYLTRRFTRASFS